MCGSGRAASWQTIHTLLVMVASGWTPATMLLRVLRGGSFSNNDRYVRCGARDSIGPYCRYDDLGFRVILSPFTSGL